MKVWIRCWFAAVLVLAGCERTHRGEISFNP